MKEFSGDFFPHKVSFLFDTGPKVRIVLDPATEGYSEKLQRN